MGWIDYEREPRSDIAFIDMKSFYASVECIQRGLNPMKTSLCVMSGADNAGGLILASSPVFKRVFGTSNVGRSGDLPFDPETRRFRYDRARKSGFRIDKAYVNFIEDWAQKTLIVPPRMALYIEENLKIQEIWRNFASDEEIFPYSIDEGFLDLTGSLDYFIRERSLSREEKLDRLCFQIQKTILRETGLYASMGMSNANPLLAKLALDNEAKKAKNLRANWSYPDVERKVWKIPKLTDFWGIGERSARRLERIGIRSVRELANSNPETLEKEFGTIGIQLWFHANGVDESKISRPYTAKSKGIGNSQVLPRDYADPEKIELVLREMAEQVAVRLRRLKKKAGSVSVYIGFSVREDRRSIHSTRKVDPTQSTETLQTHVIEIFRSRYRGGAVRRVGVTYGSLKDERYTVYTIFDDFDRQERDQKLDFAIDSLREKFGYLSVQRASFLTDASRVKERQRLIGGHRSGEEAL